MVGVAVVVAIVAVIVVIILAANRSEAPGWVQAIVLGILVSPVAIAVFIRYNFWKEVVDAVEVTETQYPELYTVFIEQVRRGGFDYRPRLYIKNGNGLLNAFASKSRLDITKGGYVVIYSDLGNVDTLRYVISQAEASDHTSRWEHGSTAVHRRSGKDPGESAPPGHPEVGKRGRVASVIARSSRSPAPRPTGASSR